ncbi:hypothetical protein D3C85_1655920 [compost metagenome]
MWVDKFDTGIELGELREVDRTVLVRPVVHERTPLGDGGNQAEEGEVVHINAREWHAVKLVFWCVQQ